MIEKERGFVAEFIIPWNILMRASTAKELTKPEIPMVRDAAITTAPSSTLRFTLSAILPAIRPAEAYGSV